MRLAISAGPFMFLSWGRRALERGKISLVSFLLQFKRA
jgi:hypothetical protein